MIKQFLEDVSLAPGGSEDFRELSEVLKGCNSYGVDAITEPVEADLDQLLGEEGLAQLLSQSRILLDNGEFDPPIFVFAKILKCRNN